MCRGDAVETSRGDAAGATWICRRSSVETGRGRGRHADIPWRPARASGTRVPGVLDVGRQQRPLGGLVRLARRLRRLRRRRRRHRQEIETLRGAALAGRRERALPARQKSAAAGLGRDGRRGRGVRAGHDTAAKHDGRRRAGRQRVRAQRVVRPRGERRALRHAPAGRLEQTQSGPRRPVPRGAESTRLGATTPPRRRDAAAD